MQNTGVGYGVAIPHALIGALEYTQVFVVVTDKPLETPPFMGRRNLTKTTFRLF